MTADAPLRRTQPLPSWDGPQSPALQPAKVPLGRTQALPERAPALADLAGAAGAARTSELPLPEGWEIYEYLGKGGRPAFAVCVNGQRMASGMPSVQSALRWARLLASART